MSPYFKTHFKTFVKVPLVDDTLGAEKTGATLVVDVYQVRAVVSNDGLAGPSGRKYPACSEVYIFDSKKSFRVRTEDWVKALETTEV